MAFEPDRAPFGFRSGFQPGRQFASAYAAMRPEVMGLDGIDAAVQQARQFPVIAGGGRGLAIPGLSQVEEVGGPSQIGNEAQTPTDSAVSALGPPTRVGNEAGNPSWASLALLGGGSALKAGKFGRELADLGVFGGGGVTPGGQITPSGGGPEAPSAATEGGDLSLGTVGRGVNVAGDVLSLAGQITDTPELGYAGSGLGVAGSALSGDYLNAIGAAVNAAIAASGKQNDPDAQAGQRALSTTLTLANAILSQTWVGAAVAAALRSAMAIYGGLEQNKSGEEITAQALYAGTPVAMFDLGGNISEHISEAFGPSKGWRTFPQRLAFNEGQQGTAMHTILSALPYVQNKDELARLVTTGSNYVAQTTGLAPEAKGAGPYALATIPGTTGTEHGVARPRVDWGPQTLQMQALIDALAPGLPGAEPTGGVALETPEQQMRLWTQFLDRERTFPEYNPQRYTTPDFMLSTTGERMAVEPRVIPAGYVEPGNVWGGGGIRYGQPGYQYGPVPAGSTYLAGATVPEPGQFTGTISPAWLALLQGVLRGNLGPTNTPGRALVAA